MLVIGFVRALYRFRRVLPADNDCPKAAVVLCLRGTDPFLEDCLRAVLNQDYPQYEIRIVVDSRQDPAWPHRRKNTRCSSYFLDPSWIGAFGRPIGYLQLEVQQSGAGREVAG